MRPYARNARTHSPKQIAQITASIREFGFNNPVLVDRDGEIIAGHGRVAAAHLIGLDTVPCVRLEHLSEAQKRAYILPDNRVAETAGWDHEIVAIEVQGLMALDLAFDVSLTGFDMPEIDVLIGELDAKPATADQRAFKAFTEPGQRFGPIDSDEQKVGYIVVLEALTREEWEAKYAPKDIPPGDGEKFD